MMVWLHFFRPRPGWYGLEDAEQQRLLDVWRAIGHDVERREQAERLGEYAVRGQSIHERVQVWRFSSAAALEAYWSQLLGAGYADWRESENVVGVPEIPFESQAGST